MVYYPAFGPKDKPKQFWGQDGMSPNRGASFTVEQYLAKHYTEVVGMKLEVNGHAWSIPKEAYEGLLVPHLDKNAVKVTLSKDAKWILVDLPGGDGAGTYLAHLSFNAAGKFKRLVAIMES